MINFANKYAQLNALLKFWYIFCIFQFLIVQTITIQFHCFFFFSINRLKLKISISLNSR